MAGAYDWGLWGALYVLHGGGSDDASDYFCAYLVSFGRAVFDRALEDPDSLAALELDTEGETWEDWMCPTAQAIHSRTGSFDFAGPPLGTRAADPTGEQWDPDSADLERRFPRLIARYG